MQFQPICTAEGTIVGAVNGSTRDVRNLVMQDTKETEAA
jgi:hypothetical protein